MSASAFFSYFGIAILFLVVDATICYAMMLLNGISIDDDEWFLFPLIINTLGFAVVASILIGQKLM